MLETRELVDKIIIFICSLAIYLFQSGTNFNIVPVLTAIICSCLLSYIDEDRVKVLLTAGFAVVSIFIPYFMFFIPLIAYDMTFGKNQLLNLIAIFPLISFFRNISYQAFFVIIIILVLSVLIRYRTKSHSLLQERFNNLSDASREMSAVLKQQNSELLEKQDNEVNLATLNERNRIAREIHDGVGHLLSSAILQVGALMTINRDEKVGNNLKTLKDTLSQAMSSIRNSVHNLYEESIDLYAQIEEAVKQFNFCEVSFDYQLSNNPDKKLKYAFIFIVKEALSNIMKHSNANHVSISFREHPAIYQLIIRDNGNVAGYSMENGMGIKNMADRVEAFNGNINILADNGFEIFISIPKEEFKS